MKINVSINDDKFLKLLDRAFAASGDLTIPLNTIADEWLKGNDALQSLKSPPPMWEDLMPITKKSKERNFGYIYPILMATGRLYASITHPRGQETIADVIGKRSLILGSRVPYGRYHQEGTRFMPARPFVMFGPEQIKDYNDGQPTNQRIKRWSDILTNWINGSIQNKPSKI